VTNGDDIEMIVDGERQVAPELAGYDREIVRVDDAVIARYPDFFADRLALVDKEIVLYTKNEKIMAIWWPNSAVIYDAEGNTQSKSTIGVTAEAALEQGYANPNVSKKVLLYVDHTTAYANGREEAGNGYRLLMQDTRVPITDYGTRILSLGAPRGSTIVMNAVGANGDDLLVHANSRNGWGGGYIHIGYPDEYMDGMNLSFTIFNKPGDWDIIHSLGNRLAVISKILIAGTEPYENRRDKRPDIILPIYNSDVRLAYDGGMVSQGAKYRMVATEDLIEVGGSFIFILGN